MKELELVELFFNVQRRIVKRLAPVAKQEGITVTEAMVLWKAHQCGTRRATALADDIGLPPSTLTGMLDRLVDAGWLERTRDPEDRRAVVMKSTTKLTDLVRSMKHAGTRALEKVMRQLPVATRERLAVDLKSVLDCLEQEERAE